MQVKGGLIRSFRSLLRLDEFQDQRLNLVAVRDWAQNVTLKTLEPLSDRLHCKISELLGEER